MFEVLMAIEEKIDIKETLTAAKVFELLTPYKEHTDFWTAFSYLNALHLQQDAGWAGKPDFNDAASMQIADLIRQFVNKQTEVASDSKLGFLQRLLASPLQPQSETVGAVKTSVEEYNHVSNKKAATPHAMRWAIQLFIVVMDLKNSAAIRQDATDTFMKVLNILDTQFSTFAQLTSMMKNYVETGKVVTTVKQEADEAKKQVEFTTKEAEIAKQALDSTKREVEETKKTLALKELTITQLEDKVQKAEGSMRSMAQSVRRDDNTKTLKAPRNMTHDNQSSSHSWSGLRRDFLSLLRIEIELQREALRTATNIAKHTNQHSSVVAVTQSQSSKSGMLNSYGLSTQQTALQAQLVKDLEALFFKVIDEEGTVPSHMLTVGAIHKGTATTPPRPLELYEKVKILNDNLKMLREEEQLNVRAAIAAYTGAEFNSSKAVAWEASYEKDRLLGFVFMPDSSKSDEKNKEEAKKMYQKLSRLVSMAAGVEEGMLPLFFASPELDKRVNAWKAEAERIDKLYHNQFSGQSTVNHSNNKKK